MGFSLLRLSLLIGAVSAGSPSLSVFGHKVPDTDAVCAAIAYAWELGERGISAQAYRLGALNRETEYVLQTLGFEAPPLLDSLEQGAPGAYTSLTSRHSSRRAR